MMQLIGDKPKHRELRRTEKMCTGILYDYSLLFTNESTDEPEFLAVMQLREFRWPLRSYDMYHENQHQN